MKVLASLNEVERVKDFVKAMELNGVDCTVKSLDRNYVVDGRSILGIFSLDLSKLVEVECLDHNKVEVFAEVVEEFRA